MTLSLHTIKKSKAVSQKRKRIGRGNASGTGTYSGKGLKGQKSRSGVSKLKLKKIGMKHGRSALRGVPKLPGFKSMRPKAQVVNVLDINKHFKDKEEINPKTLLKKGLIDNMKQEVKILGRGELKVKGLGFSSVKLSKKVAEQLEKLGGKIIETKVVETKKEAKKK